MQPRTLGEVIADAVDRARTAFPGADQLSNAYRAIFLRGELVPRRPGTPQRLHRNLGEEDEKGHRPTRGERKREARRRADAAILAEYQAAKKYQPGDRVIGFNPYLAAPYVGDEASALAIDEGTRAHEAAERVGRPPVQEDGDLTSHTPAPSLEVVQQPDGLFYVFEEGGNLIALAGPYKDRKTANRRMRQLGG